MLEEGVDALKACCETHARRGVAVGAVACAARSRTCGGAVRAAG